jgi:hypothetical protein
VRELLDLLLDVLRLELEILRAEMAQLHWSSSRCFPRTGTTSTADG